MTSFFSAPLRSVVAALVVAAGIGTAHAEDNAVARIDGYQLGIDDIQALLKPLDPAARAKLVGDRQQLITIIRAELARRAVLDSARQANFEQKPDVERRLARAREDALMNLYVNSIAAPPDTYPSDDEVRQAYDANLTRFMLPRQYHLAHIFISTGTPADVAARHAKADDLARKARTSGADFGQLARTGSEDTATAATGGDLGWTPETQLIPQILTAIKGASDNEVVGPIETKEGWHIVRQLGTRPAGPQSLETIRPALVASLRQQRASRDASAYLEKLLADRHAAINEIALDKLAPASATKP